MNSLIISNRIREREGNPDVELYHWSHERPSTENYQNVILDLYFGKPATDGYAQLKGTSQTFYEIGTEISKSLKSGGVVVATLGPLAINEHELGTNEDEKVTIHLKRRDATHAGKYIGANETSYDWLDQGFLEVTKIDALHKRNSSNINVVANWREAQEYFKNVKQFWTSVGGLGPFITPTQATLTYQIMEAGRWDTSQSSCQSKAWILAFSEHTREPIALVTNYLHNAGLLVLVPPFDMEPYGTARHAAQSLEIVRTLVDFANSIREQLQRFEVLVIPDWAVRHRSQKASLLSNEINELATTLDSFKLQLVEYDEMLYLLCAKGDLLNGQIHKLFADPAQGIIVEPTPPGHSLDLFIKDNTGRILAVEVTGTRGKLTKDDHHWADFLHYLPEHTEKNQNGRIERMVLIVNTQAELPLERRTKKGDITSPVLDIAKDNHICIIRSCDLYGLWLLTQDGSISLQDIFNTLFEQEGLYDCSKFQ